MRLNGIRKSWVCDETSKGMGKEFQREFAIVQMILTKLVSLNLPNLRCITSKSAP